MEKASAQSTGKLRARKTGQHEKGKMRFDPTKGMPQYENGKGDHLQSIAGTRPVLISDEPQLLADLTSNFPLRSLTMLNSFPGQIFIRLPSMPRTLCHVRPLFTRFHIHQEVHLSIAVSLRFWSLLEDTGEQRQTNCSGQCYQ